MPTNFYFDNFAHTGQQNLIEDLIIESIKIYGYDNFYIPRTIVKEDDLFGEDVLSKFDNALPLEMYVKNVEGFDGEGEFLTKFNLEVRDQITFSIAQRRWQEEIDITDRKIDEQGERVNRPTEGDLIFFPLTGQLYEIKYVDKQPIFYQMGQLQMYDLRCELFEFSHERVSTGVKAIDDLAARHTINVLNFQILLESSKERAEGTAILTGDSVSSVTLTNVGDYVEAPTITFGAPPAAQKAIATSTITGDAVTSATVNPNNRGSGYVSNVPVTFSNPETTQRLNATATASISGGSVSSVTVTVAGGFYTTAPPVTVTASPTGDDAVLTSNIGGNSVINLQIISAGSGYTTAPTITIGAPNNAIHFAATGIAVPDANGNIGNITITNGGKYYENAPSVNIGNPPDSVRATATSTISGTSVSTITITEQGRGYMNVNGTPFVPSVTFSVETFVGGIRLEDGDGLLLEATANTTHENSTANNTFFETSKTSFLDFSELNPFSEGTDW